MELEFSRQILEEYSNIKLRENPSSGTDGRTDRTKVLRTRLKTSKAQWSIYVPYSGHYMCLQWSPYVPTVVTICTVQWSLYVPYSGHYMYRTVVTICTASLTFSNSTFCPHTVFMCFVWISEQTAIISLYNINWLVFITETECVYCVVRTGYLYIIQVSFSGL